MTTSALPPIHAVVDGVPCVLPHRTVRLPDGRVGYFQTGNGDVGGCLAACVAVVTQVPLDQLGPIGSLGQLHAWAEGRGLEVQLHLDGLPDAPQWIGMTAALPGGGRHTIVGAHDRLYFDPSQGWEFPGGLRAPAVREIAFAITLEPRGTTTC